MIELKQAEKLYGKADGLKDPARRAALPGLHETTLSIPEGQVVGILGDNGAGKSTLLQAVAGLLPLTAGRITIGGKAPAASYGSLAYVTGEGSYMPRLTPVQYGDFLAEMVPAFDRSYYDKLLQFFQLPESRRICTLSTGQRGRVEVAAGLARRAKVLLLDEPFLGKDIFTRQDFVRLLSATLSGEETVLITTHQVEEIEMLLDRAVILHEGRVTADWLLDDLRTQGLRLTEAMRSAVGYDPRRYKMLLENAARQP